MTPRRYIPMLASAVTLRRRTAALARGEGFMSFTVAEPRFKRAYSSALEQRQAGGRVVAVRRGVQHVVPPLFAFVFHAHRRVAELRFA
jgi:hypothetical protein